MEFKKEWQNLKFTAQKEWLRLTYKQSNAAPKVRKRKVDPKWLIVVHAAFGMFLSNIAQITAQYSKFPPQSSAENSDLMVIRILCVFLGYIVSERFFWHIRSKIIRSLLAVIIITFYVLSNTVTQ